MFRRFSIILIALMLAACATTAPIIKRDSEATYKRPNLVVTDMERSIALYEGLLGFSSGDIQVSSADSFSYPVFNIPRDAKIRFVTMDDKQDNRAFALTEVTGADLPSLPNRPHMTAHVIGVSDLAGKIAAVEAMGLTTSPSKTVDGTEFRFVEQAFTDYDGHLIVLYEVLSP